MGLTVAMESNVGKRFIEVNDPQMLLNTVLVGTEDDRFHLWRFIDPYGDTVFNGLQMNALKVDIRKLLEIVKDSDVHSLLKRIEEMADACELKPHTFIRFIGD